MQEKTLPVADGIVSGDPLASGANIRRSGEDVATGSMLVEAGTLLDYRHIGILASAGVGKVAVRPRVRVALFSTGTEVRPAGEQLEPGQIYDVNGPMLSALLARDFIELVAALRVVDDPDAIAALLRESSAGADLIISTGGAAGSDSDHALRALLLAGGNGTALRMALRPGKPIVVGRIGSCTILSLPGNPLAALINFLLVVRPAIQALTGQEFKRPRGQAALAAENIVHMAGRTEFAPGRIVGFASDGRPRVVRIGRGGSARLRPLVEADGFIELDPSNARVGEDTPVQFHPFKASFGP
jgi:molybdopterin molybdotransferase